MRRYSVLFFTLVLFQLSSQAQIKTHLPYSIFGIGELNPNGYSRNMGMGRTGIAMSSSLFLNNVNPASLHDMDSISFFFDFGLSGSFNNYKTDFSSQHGSDVNIHNIAIGFRINPKWSASVGISPFSTVGYKIKSIQGVEGNTDTYTAVSTGSGGLSQFYFDNSYVLFHHLSLGVHAAYVFGNIQSDETVNYSLFPYTILSSQVSRLNKLLVDFGFQYFIPIKDKFRVSVGGIFGNSHRLNFKESITVSQSNGTVFEDKITRTGTFDLPYYYGAGLAFEWNRKLSVSADYLYNNWSSVTSDNSNYHYVNTHSFRVGLEFIPGPLDQYGYIGRLSYRVGYYHEGSYIQLGKNNIPDNGYSVGIGLPFLKTKTSVNISYNGGFKGTTNNGLIRENYHSFLLSLTLHDWWFVKAKYD